MPVVWSVYRENEQEMTRYPDSPRQWATMWWDMHGAGQVVVKVKVTRDNKDGTFRCNKWNHPDIIYPRIPAEHLHYEISKKKS
jgi:hypothetical protein